MKHQQRGAAGIILLVWLVLVTGWVANIAQIVMQMPATLGEATPMWVFKIVTIFMGPVGSIMGYIGMF